MKEGEGEKESNLSAPHRSDQPSDRIGGFISPPGPSPLFDLVSTLDYQL